MEFCEAFVVHLLVAIDTIYRENLHRGLLMLGQVTNRHSGCVCPQYQPFRFVKTPSVFPTPRTGYPAVFVGFRYRVDYVSSWQLSFCWVCKIEGVHHLPSRVVLRLEKGVEVPEGCFNDGTANFCEAHL